MSTALDLRSDRFASVLGSGRGHPEPLVDTVRSLTPTARAQADLQRLCRSLLGRDADCEAALAALRSMHENEPLPPLERKLRAALGRYAAEQALRDTEHIVRRLLTDARLRTPARSEHLVTVSADGGRYIHLWLEGHLYNHPAEAPRILLACRAFGTDARAFSADACRQSRGRWCAPASNRFTSDRWRCPTCLEALKAARGRGLQLRLPDGVPVDILHGNFPLLSDTAIQTTVSRIDGETREHTRHAPALPYHTQLRYRRYLTRVLTDIFLQVPADNGQLRELSRAHALVAAFDYIATDTVQAGWLRRLGIVVSPALERQLPLLREDDMGVLLRRLCPPAYHTEGWRILGDLTLWSAWLGSDDYGQAVLDLPAAVRARLRTRRRGIRTN